MTKSATASKSSDRSTENEQLVTEIGPPSPATSATVPPPPSPPTIDPFQQMTQQISKHNRCIDGIKARIQTINSHCPITCIEQQELNCLQTCLEKEMRSLNAVIQMAIEQQSKQPDQAWGAIPISTSIEEDQLPHVMFYPPESFKTPPVTRKKQPQASDSAKSASAARTTNAAGDETSPSTGSDPQKQRSVDDDVDHEQLQADIKYRDMMIECLQQKMRCLRDEMQRICAISKRPPCLPCAGGGGKGRSAVARVHKKICCPVAAANKLQENALQANCIQEQMDQMSQVLHQLQLELSTVQKERTELGRYRQSGSTSTDNNSSSCVASCLPMPMPCVGGGGGSPCVPCGLSCVHDELVNQHNTLLGEYSKKDRECKYLREKLAALDAATAGKPGGDSVEKVQIDILNRRISDLRDEEEEFKMLIGEQQKQIGEYRNKFLQAQQTVVEQRATIDGMEVTKQQIEEQINGEVQRIKTRFQEKLRELAPLPKLLESEQFRAKTLRQENEDLVTQINTMTAQLRKARKDVKRLGQTQSGGEGKAEINSLKRSVEQAETEKADLNAQLRLLQEELCCMRSETQKVMVRNKERSECSREALQARIDKLEIQLAETRAKGALKLADRDQVIQNMQEQLSDLSSNFGNAQKQIRTLKRRICGLTEADTQENCKC